METCVEQMGKGKRLFTKQIINMTKRSQIQIAIEALKKQLDKYALERDKAELAEGEAKKSKIFFATEIDRLEKQIQSLEGPSAGNL